MDQLKKGRMNPTVQKFYLTCKSWDLTLVKYDSGKVFFFHQSFMFMELL